MQRLLIPLGLALLLMLASCSSDGDCGGAANAAMSCAAGVDYDGHFYQEWSDRPPPVRGAALGDAVHPPCDDTGGCGPDTGPGDPTKVWRLKGVAPEEVIVGRSQPDDSFVVLGRPGVDPEVHFRLDGHGDWHLRRR